LELLENDARLNAQDLADILNEDAKDVAHAVRRMEDQKIICGYHTVINYNKVLRDERIMAFIEVDVSPMKDQGYDHTAALLAKYPEIDSLYLITGDNDFICLVQGRTMFEVCQFVADRIAVMEHVQSTKTLFVLKQYKQSGVLTGAARTANSEGRLVVSY
ncbi:MAG: Lrp/AsnC family transcriptional regulator, partial [Bifidobacterium pseudolongum subsp. globosum]|nr:Lrp/AsnC family transcriptional regulator [Bifidobacterium pseudolongum subsp. globosum]